MKKVMMNPSVQFASVFKQKPALKQCCWLALIVQTILGIALLTLFPGKLHLFIAGVVLATGFIYLIGKNALQPQPKLQGAFSFGRMGLLALATVMLGHWNIVETGVVLLGFLGYNLVLILFAIGCALKEWKRVRSVPLKLKPQ
jgi:hypothetical protein